MRNRVNRRAALVSLLLTLATVLNWSTLPGSSSQAAPKAIGAVPGPNSPSVPRSITNGKIAFASWRDGSPEIYTMNPDGREVRRLTFDSKPDVSNQNTGPVWSPDGSKIAFTHHHIVVTGTDAASRSEIGIMNSDGSNQRLLTAFDGMDRAPAWSPDGTKILFSRADGAPYRFIEIYVMNADGSDQHRLTTSGYSGGATWSPDGGQIAYQMSDRISTVNIMNADGSNQRAILNGYLFSRSWSPDGSKLAVLPQGMNGIWLVNVDSGQLTQIDEPVPPTEFPVVFYAGLSWSPDGSQIAFSRGFSDAGYQDDLGPEIMVVDANGGRSRKISGAEDYASEPTWSPDGLKIVFTGGPLFVMNPDGSGLTNIGNTSAEDFNPSWQAVPLLPSAIDDAQFFVRQQYLDFLNREPDANGLAFWTNEIMSCAGDGQCIEAKRINVSAAYFLSIEFQQTGYEVYRIYKAAYGTLPNAPVPITFNEFLPDTKGIGQGVVVNQTGWEQVLENNKQAFATEFVQRSRFVSAYPTSMSAEQFVDALFANAGVTPSATDRTAAINEFAFVASTADMAARARALRRVAENSTLAQQEFNRAFVLMQYFGYLRRNPNDAPDTNFDGYNFWLDKLNQFNGEFVRAKMVRAFLISLEYRHRFGP
jgi:Tol biopolymer transport system component